MAAKQYEQIVSLACVNFHPEWGQKAVNLKRIKQFIVQAAQEGNNIIAFGELALSGSDCSDDIFEARGPCSMHREAAETIPGPVTDEMVELAKEHGVYIIIGMPERDKSDANVLYISAPLIGPEGVIGVQRKLHTCGPPAFLETMCFKRGNAIPVFETKYGLIGLQVCYDFLFFPELSRIQALKGARLLINVTGSLAGPGKPYPQIQQTGARAMENWVYAASANLVGKDKNFSFCGHSVIAGPVPPKFCQILAEGDERFEQIVSATLDLEKAEYWHNILPWKKDRQTELINREFRELAALASEAEVAKVDYAGMPYPVQPHG